MPPPVRNTAADYHFHAYDYAAPAPAAWQLSVAQPARNNWQFYSMEADLNGLAAWGLVQGVPNMAVINVAALPGAASADGVARNITGISFGGPLVPNPATPEVVITGGIHAREWIAPEMAYLLAEYLIRNYNAGVGASLKEQALCNLINSRRIHIIPMLNPNGNSYTVFGVNLVNPPRMWRKNRRVMPATAVGWLAALTNVGITNLPFQNAVINITGNCQYEVPRYDPNGVPPGAAVYDTYSMTVGNIGVNLNRNFDTPAWGYNCPREVQGQTVYVPATAGTESYCGPARQSEPETGFIEGFLAGLNNVHTSIDYHSFSKLILYPSEVFNQGFVNANYTHLGQVLQKLIGPWNEPVFSYDYGLGSPRNTTLRYDATGTLADREALTYGSRAFVVELDPASPNPGFELPENQIQTVFEKNIRGALALIAAAGQLTTVAHNIFGRGRAITSAEGQYLNWNVFGQGNQIPP